MKLAVIGVVLVVDIQSLSRQDWKRFLSLEELTMVRLMIQRLFIATVFVSAASAQAIEQKLNWSPKMKTASPILKTNLATQKKDELNKKWTECAKLAPANFQANTALRGWILISWIHCASQKATDGKSWGDLQNALNSVTSHPELLTYGPWRKNLLSESVKARLALVDGIQQTKPAEAWKQVDILMQFKDQLDKTQRAKVYQYAGELSKTKAQLKAAKNFFEYSLNEMETKDVRDDYNSLLFALNENKPVTVTPPPVPPEALTEAEQKFEDRLQSSVKNNDLITQVEDCVSYLKQFPNGRRAKWAQDRVFDVYTSFLDKAGDQKMDALRERTLGLMQKVDALRALEWAKSLHRRADFQGSLKLAEKALDTLDGTMSAAPILYIAGRSAELTGDYSKASKFFQKYIDAHAGAEDINEVLFRLSLSQLREEQYSSAIANLEKLLIQKNIDRYELSAHYWLVRALQWTKNQRANTEADLVIAKFPFSYYGLRLRLEKQNSQMDWPTSLKVEKPPQGSFFLTGEQKKILDRAQTLGQNGWTSEAISEISTLPDPNDPQVKALLAQQFGQLGDYPAVIRLVNEAGDQDASLRSLDVVSLGLPQVFKDVIDDQAQKQKLNPLLVRSLIRQESAFGTKAVSSSNAQGLMQLIPPTANQVVSEMGLSNVDVPDDLANPDVNITMGTYYIAKMIQQFGGNVPLGLAAYNAGPTRMQLFVKARPEVLLMTKKQSGDAWDELWFDEVPWNETSFYVKAILRNVIVYRLADKALAKNPDERRVQFAPVLWSDLVLPRNVQ